ncbi:DUF1661 domain-containing protein [Porphyromonas gulae]
MVRARRREKRLKEEENEKKKISYAKKNFNLKCWRLVGNKGHKGGEKGVEKTEVINRTSRNSNRKSPKSQTKIHKKWREILFVPARDFFNSRTKTKFFSDHVLQPQIHRIFQTKMDMTELSTKSEDIIIRGDRLTSEKRVFYSNPKKAVSTT